jgi:hypothetical protein
VLGGAARAANGLAQNGAAHVPRFFRIDGSHENGSAGKDRSSAGKNWPPALGAWPDCPSLLEVRMGPTAPSTEERDFPGQ